jgi:hypothetical protein
MVFDVKPFGPPTLDRRRHRKLQILRLGTHRDNSPTQLRLIRQRNAGAETKDGSPKKKVGFDPQE